MGSHFEKRIFAFLLLGLLHFGRADAAGDLVIRGDQSKPLLSEIPVPVRPLPEWVLEKQQNNAETELKNLLTDVEFFTREPEETHKTERSAQNQNSEEDKQKAVDGVNP